MKELDESIASVLGSRVLASDHVGGGCVHECKCLTLADDRRVFVKFARGAKSALLAAEARGLGLLAPHIRVPRVLGDGSIGDSAWLALEWLDFGLLRDHADLGRRLAALHGVKGTHYGLDHDNFIGATPQANQAADTWRGFFIDRRLRPQIDRAKSRGHDLDDAAMLGRAEKLLADHEPAPSLLHGDLWSGNAASLPDATSVVFDPAPYFGDPETDLAMFELFGAPLTSEFLAGYGPVAPDRARRRPLYNLYHALNHLNLFGSGYGSMVRECLDGMRE